MVRDLRVAGATLPSLPLALPPLEGSNLRRAALMLDPRFRSAEEAIVHFRQQHRPEALPYFRRYYLKPHLRGGKATGRYSLRYVWNLSRPDTDRTVGVLIGDDIAAAQVLIGNGVAGARMTPIRWELCEDRDGEEPIAIGRFDPWSLLRDVHANDIDRLAQRDIMPHLAQWDFDQHFMERACPGCAAAVRVNMRAFNIDSAQCERCGIRPFLSWAIAPLLRDALPEVTGATGALITPDAALLHAVSWMGGVGAAATELHREALPEELTPHGALLALLEHSALPQGAAIADDLPADLMRRNDEEAATVKTLAFAGQSLAAVVRNGGPFTPMHAAMANLLRTAQREAARLERSPAQE